jgi:hypothetical protein
MSAVTCSPQPHHIWRACFIMNINKVGWHVQRKAVCSACTISAAAGWILVKFYCILGLPTKSVEKLQILFQPEKNIGHFKIRRNFFYTFWDQKEIFCTSTPAQRKPIIGFPWKHTKGLYCRQLQLIPTMIQTNVRLRSVATMVTQTRRILRFTYAAHLISSHAWN